MCEPLLPIEELENLKFSIAALAHDVSPKGSYQAENRKNAASGIENRIDWCIRMLKAAGEGKKNMGV